MSIEGRSVELSGVDGRRWRAQVSEHEDANGGGEIAAPGLIDLADDCREGSLMMARDRLEPVPEFILEADAGLAAGDDDRSFGDCRMHGYPVLLSKDLCVGLTEPDARGG